MWNEKSNTVSKQDEAILEIVLEPELHKMFQLESRESKAFTLLGKPSKANYATAVCQSFKKLLPINIDEHGEALQSLELGENVPHYEAFKKA